MIAESSHPHLSTTASPIFDIFPSIRCQSGNSGRTSDSLSMFFLPTSACSALDSTEIKVPLDPITLAKCIASPAEPCPPSSTLEPTPIPIQEIRNPESLAPITWALLAIFLLASGSEGLTIVNDFCPTVILSPAEYPLSSS